MSGDYYLGDDIEGGHCQGYLRPQWFFYVPPILVSNEAWSDETCNKLVSEPLKVKPFADVITKSQAPS